nr:DNA-directed DNA polymerase [Tanacetum cinerariifolium]
METRSSSRLVRNPSSNLTPSTNPNPKGRNGRHSKQRIEEFNLDELSPPIVMMADQRTLAQLLQTPTEGYEDAIVVPTITDDNFELKHGLLTLVQNKQFFGHGKEDPHAHIRYFNKITSTLKFPNVSNTSIKLMLFPFYLEGAARIWLEKEPPRSIFTWDDLALKLINQFIPPSKTTNLRNEITNFQQRFDESFSEAWDRFKDLLRACPHHVSTNTSTSGISHDVAELKDMVKALLLDKQSQNQAPATVKAVEESCELSYKQNYDDNYYPHDLPSFSCCDNCGESHETFQCQPMDQNIDFSGSDQIQTPQYLDIHPPSQEISDENSNQEKEGPPQDSDIRQLIREEWCIKVSEEQKQRLEDTILELVEIYRQKELLCMHDNVDDLIEIALNSKLLSINSQLAPILSTKEPEYSPSMGYEHPNTTPKMESDEIIKFGVEELVPILSENEVTSEDKKECDVPVCENSPICDDNSEIFSDSKNDEDISSDDDDFEDIEYVEASLSDPEIVNVEEENVVYQEEEEVDLEDVFQIQDVILCEKLLSINRLIANIESLNDNPTPDRVLNSSVSFLISEESDNSLSDNSSPEFETFCDHTEETRSGNTTTHANESLPKYDSFCFEIEPDQERLINVVKNDIFDDSTRDPLLEEADLFLASDNSIPPGIENFAYDSEGDIRFLETLLSDDSIPFLVNESSESYFDNPSFPRPPPEPPDAKFDFELDAGKEISVVMNTIDELECRDPREEFDDDNYSSFMFVICSKMFLSFLSAESEDTIFDPGHFVEILSGEIKVHVEVLSVLWDNRLPIWTVRCRCLGPVYQPPVFQPPAYQAPAYQASAPQTQGVSKEDFSAYVKANDAVMRNMQTQGQNMQNQLTNLTDLLTMFVNSNNASTSNSGTLPSNTIANPRSDLKVITTQSGVSYDRPQILPLPSFLPKVVENEPEVTKDTVHPTNNGSTEDVKPLVVQSKSPILTSEPVNSPTIEPVISLVTDLSASINLMPLSVWNKLSLPDLTLTCMTLELADRSISRLVGVAKDVYVKVGTFHFSANFVVVDFDADPRVPLILGRYFLMTGRALIDVFKGELTLRVGKEAITFNLDQTSRCLANYNDMTAKRIDVIDMACEEYSQEVLVRKELKIYEAKSDKSSIDEPPEVKLKYIPPHIEYAFLEGDDKLPVIIAKDLSMEEKTAFITVLKSHKRAIAWKLFDIKDWDMPFELMCDTSDFAIGVVLGKHQDKHFRPIHYASKTLTESESNYTTKEKEMLAVVYAFEKFRSYLIMNKSIVYTDHSALKYLFPKKDSKARLLRWVLLLQEFTFKVIDTKGAENLAANHLSRLETPHQNVLDPKEINESFPPETLNLVSTRSNSNTPWKPLTFSRLSTMDPPRNTMAQITQPRRGNKYILVAVDYLSKWVEAKVLPTNEARVVCKIFEKSLFQIWNPPSHISDRGTHFCNDQFAKVMQKFGVTHHLATPYHPQTSGQVEVSNCGLKPYKTPIGCTLYKLVYGKACHLPIELEHKAYWALKHANFDLKTVGDHKKAQLNELNELRDQAYENSLIYKEKTKRLHDSKIKDRVFNIGDRVPLFNSRLKIFFGKLKSRCLVHLPSLIFIRMALSSYHNPTGQISK